VIDLKDELNLIDNVQIKNFVIGCLDIAPDYFWKIPSSSTGKYHPKDEIKEGGLILHVKRSVKIATDLCRCFEVVGDDRDCVISAMIMHDVCKNGYPVDAGHTVDGHGSLWINIAMHVSNKMLILNSKTIRLIGRLIGGHMGRFDMPFIGSENILDWIVQSSDYISSRDYVIVNVNEENNV